MKIKKIFKYGTGDVVPEGSVYLTSIIQEIETAQDNVNTLKSRLVWHYFVVEIEE